MTRMNISMLVASWRALQLGQVWVKSRARGADEAADDYDHKAQGGELNDDLCCHLTEAALAGNQLSIVSIELVRELAILPHIIDFIR